MAIVVAPGSLEIIKARATYPLKLIWPRGARVVAPRGKCRRVAGGRLEVEYSSREELEAALRLAKARD